eukprot:TRINITY_DN19224_c0_g1_i3.p1 TRINITY_DN19224_c0_g1~~TRINITY_DN19224_c0_g1_i3.p1  ORF type:complete len:176 (-),score=19.45 TRINITY_DN19224_c0_g1_i3:214-741(-)
MRPAFQDNVRFQSRLVVGRTERDSRKTVSVGILELRCHTHVQNVGLAAAVVTDKEYPSRVAFALIAEAMRVFSEAPSAWDVVTVDSALPCAGAVVLFEQFKNPEEADKLTRVQKDLDEIHVVMLQSMDDLMKRGETMEGLIDKAKDLSDMSKQFRKQAEKNNSCLSGLKRLLGLD